MRASVPEGSSAPGAHTSDRPAPAAFANVQTPLWPPNRAWLTSIFHVLQIFLHLNRSPTDEKNSSSVIAWRRAALWPCRLAPWCSKSRPVIALGALLLRGAPAAASLERYALRTASRRSLQTETRSSSWCRLRRLALGCAPRLALRCVLRRAGDAAAAPAPSAVSHCCAT